MSSTSPDTETKRPVIVHYHLFKNAGSSVDQLLERNFEAGEWAEIEGPDNKKLDPEPLLAFIRDNSALKAVSSHTAVISLPAADDIEIIPVVFLRHPIDRIRSAYDFERKQVANTPGARVAKEGDFAHYMNWRLSTPVPWQVSNFHAMRLKDFNTFTPAKRTELFLPRATAAIEALPFVGLVERFDESMAQFARLIRAHFPDFQTQSVRANTTADTRASVQDNLDAFRDRIGADTYARLEAVNAMDLQLYARVKSRFPAM